MDGRRAQTCRTRPRGSSRIVQNQQMSGRPLPHHRQDLEGLLVLPAQQGQPVLLGLATGREDSLVVLFAELALDLVEHDVTRLTRVLGFFDVRRNRRRDQSRCPLRPPPLPPPQACGTLVG